MNKSALDTNAEDVASAITAALRAHADHLTLEDGGVTSDVLSGTREEVEKLYSQASDTLVRGVNIHALEMERHEFMQEVADKLQPHLEANPDLKKMWQELNFAHVDGIAYSAIHDDVATIVHAAVNGEKVPEPHHIAWEPVVETVEKASTQVAEKWGSKEYGLALLGAGALTALGATLSMAFDKKKTKPEFHQALQGNSQPQFAR